MTPKLSASAATAKTGERRGVVIVAVLLVVTILALAAYQYYDLMQSEYRASQGSHRIIQTRAFADSGIHYAAAMLSNSDNFTNTLASNPWNNTQCFQDQPVMDSNGKTIGYFSIIAPPDPDDPGASTTDFRYGVTDESGKINLNALMRIDPTGQTLTTMLMLLPNMTQEIASAIIDWLDPDDTTTNPGGAENDYYEGLSPSYRCKNGPIDSIDELLLVKGVTWELLYGTDFNRNGVQDGTTETGSASINAVNGFDRGWSAYLTVFSREPNYDANNNIYTYLNNTDLTQIYTPLSNISEDLAKFVVMYRQYGPANSSGKAQSALSTLASVAGISTGGGSTPTGTLSSYTVTFNKSGGNNINSIFDLITAQVSVTSTVNNRQVTTVYASPLGDPAQGQNLLAQLFATSTLWPGSASNYPSNEMPARININTAPSAVLATLPNLTATDVANIISARPTLTSTNPPDPNFQSPAWLYFQVQLSATKLSGLDQYITTRSQVYRVQSVGYFDNSKGPAIRLEAVIDANVGRPRIIAWRNMSELGKGWNMNGNNNGNGNGNSGP